MKPCQEAQVATHFAPAGRDSDEELGRLSNVIGVVPLFQATIDAMPEIVLIHNVLRQVVGFNQAACDFLGAAPGQAIGKRLGELAGCVNAKVGPDGCGTAKACVTCGAVNAILESQREHGQDTRECRIVLESKRDGGAMDLEVTATAFDVDDENYTICFIKDISRTKRLDILTRMFFHDALNTSGGIRGFAEMMAVEASIEGDKGEDLARLATLASQLVEEIQAQRDLTYAESGELVTHFEPVETATFLENLRTLYATHKVATDRDIELCDVWGGSIVTDRRLLARVLGNMLKNALEATEPGGVVEVRCTDDGDRVTFSVWNASVMPNRVQLQVFQRSFSTKAKAGRGIGTHSMKLLGESHLGGRVSFSSKAPEGTVFTVELPKKPTTVSTEERGVAETLPIQTLHGRVLLAEDGPDNQRLISFLLKKAGLDVDLAENGRIACERALASESEGRPYDLILMDVQMPELDGHGATRHLRKHGWQGPIVALTALVTKADHEKCLEAGCTDCVTKPIDRATLLATAARHLQPTRVQSTTSGS